ncbi:MAG TPA: peptidylprolyl isomerase, partial [Gemmatimonadales bacterium]|nr:peptidylprolyl isomerase [Gemmatimonadales bacterium]
LARHRDAVIRSLVADAIGRGGSPADVPLLLEMYRMAGRDSFPEAAQSALGAIAVLARNAPNDPESIERGALAQLAPPENYLIRLWAEENWPAAAAAWGQAFPLSSERTMEDYRDIVRRLQVGPDSARYPRVRVDIDQVGVVELELYGPEAPLTVANFLRLADRRYFDGQRFHRVVPNFVVQAGDPRGDGWGGPGGAIRDEINERRYGPYTVGMALSGPDTGGSQWFITLSAQPHLDGGYTVFGEVTGGVPALLRVTQGDLIRSIRH